MKTGFASPRGICNGMMNKEPVLFVADSDSSSIRVVTLKDGNVSHLIGGDPEPTVTRLNANISPKKSRFSSESFGFWRSRWN